MCHRMSGHGKARAWWVVQGRSASPRQVVRQSVPLMAAADSAKVAALAGPEHMRPEALALARAGLRWGGLSPSVGTLKLGVKRKTILLAAPSASGLG